MNNIIKEYIDEGNAIEIEIGTYATQDSNYNNRLTFEGLKEYYIKEYL